MHNPITIDVRLPPCSRWQLAPELLVQARELLEIYKADLGLGSQTAEFLTASAQTFIRAEHWQEMESLSSGAGIPLGDVVLGNIYYDLLKLALATPVGCTSFAVDAPGGVLHARNLDWWTERSALSRYTAVSNFIGGPAGPFTTVGWPGFVGAFSGIAPGRFAVTLNAVISHEPVQPAMPVVFLLRTVLEEARSFSEARRLLCESPIPCDCLLLLTGVEPGELVVIERSPSQYACRDAHQGSVCVTNGYRILGADPCKDAAGILLTSCQRFECMERLISRRPPQTPEECMEYLRDPEIQMSMTVQQMVFRASTGEHWTRLPDSRWGEAEEE